MKLRLPPGQVLSTRENPTKMMGECTVLHRVVDSLHQGIQACFYTVGARKSMMDLRRTLQTLILVYSGINFNGRLHQPVSLAFQHSDGASLVIAVLLQTSIIASCYLQIRTLTVSFQVFIYKKKGDVINRITEGSLKKYC